MLYLWDIVPQWGWGILINVNWCCDDVGDGDRAGLAGVVAGGLGVHRRHRQRRSHRGVFHTGHPHLQRISVVGLFAKSDVLDGIEHLDTADSIVDHPRVVVPEHIRRWLRDIFDNAHLRGWKVEIGWISLGRVILLAQVGLQ